LIKYKEKWKMVLLRLSSLEVNKLQSRVRYFQPKK